MPQNPRYDEAMRRFIENIDEPAFHLALEHAPDPKFQAFLLNRLDPHYKNMTFAQMCRNHGITLADMDDVYRKGQIHLGMIRGSNHLPQVVEDVIVDAKSKQQYCMRCDGRGYIKDEDGPENSTRECPMCHGLKEIRVPGDNHARDLVYESYGLIGKRGPAVAIQINNAVDAELGDLLSTSQKVLAGRSEDES